MILRPKKKRLTIVEAWELLALGWESPEFIGDSNVAYVVIAVDGGLDVLFGKGLCGGISILVDGDFISWEIRTDMMRQMRTNCPKNAKRPYWWSCTKKGAAARARFCRKMADKCRRDKLSSG